MTVPRILNKPHYVFRPKQVLVRLRSGRESAEDQAEVVVRLPWGLDLAVRPTDAVGHTVTRTGIFDPAVSEALLRLTDPGELAVDVGANVGYMTSLLAIRAGEAGTVICFEPQPAIRSDLEGNVARWRQQGLNTKIDVRGEALSSESGVGYMSRTSPGENRDARSLRVPTAGCDDELYEVAVGRLDGIVDPEAASIALLKIDVERHELQVLLGSEALLTRRAIRDIVFEEHDDYPTPVTQLLERHGYTLFLLDHDLFGPWIGAPTSTRRPMTDTSYLATVAPQRALSRLRKRGWQIFRRSRGRDPFTAATPYERSRRKSTRLRKRD